MHKLSQNVSASRGFDYRKGFNATSNGSGALTCDLNFFSALNDAMACEVKGIGFCANDKIVHFMSATIDGLAVVRVEVGTPSSTYVMRMFRTRNDMLLKSELISLGGTDYRFKAFPMATTLDGDDTMGFGGYDIDDSTELTDAAADSGLANTEVIAMGVRTRLYEGLYHEDAVQYQDCQLELEKCGVEKTVTIDLTAETDTTAIITGNPRYNRTVTMIEFITNGTDTTNIVVNYVNPGLDIPLITCTTMEQIFACADCVDEEDGQYVARYILDPKLMIQTTGESLSITETAASQMSVRVTYIEHEW